MKVGVVGLGSMGFGIASSLVRAGHEVVGSDVNRDTMSRLREAGGAAEELEGAAPTLDALVLVVLNAAQVETILFADSGVAKSMATGSVVICCVTVSPDFARDIASRCDALGIHFLDAPISGGSVKAAQGKLSIMSSGTAAAYERARPVLSSIAETVFELGGAAGAGSAMKAVNQMLAGIHIAAMAEAITFGIKQGISPATFLEVIPKCAGTSWMLENRAPHVAAGDYTPHSSIAIWPKDLGIVLDVARSSSFPAPLTAAALQQFVSAVAMGLSLEDDAAVAKVYAQLTRISLPGESRQ